LATENGVYYLSTPLVAPQTDGEYVHVPIGFVLSQQHLLTVRFAKIPAIDAAFTGKCPDAPSAFLHVLEVIVDRSADALERASADSDLLSHEAFRFRKKRSEIDLRENLRRIGGLADRTSHIRDALLGIGRIAGYVSVDEARLKAIRADIVSLTD